MKIQKFKFENVEIEFDLRQGKNMMVNATEMANVFGREMKDFNKLDSTKKFIETCLISDNSSLIGLTKREDLIISVQNSGTWMHRILALKFAAWLSPEFEVWVYSTIDQLLYQFANEIEDSINETVMLSRKKDDLKNKLAKRDPECMEYFAIEQKLINARMRRSNATKTKFREKFDDLFSSQKNNTEE